MILRPRVEMDFGAGFVDISEDVVTNVKADFGIQSADPRIRIADPGEMAFSLDNTIYNSGGLQGFYSPSHTNTRSGFAIGTKVRLIINHLLFGDHEMWTGTISKIMPKAGARGQLVSVSCVDWLQEAVQARLDRIAVQENVQSDALFSILVGVPTVPPPNGTRVGSGSDIYPFALDNTQDEKGNVLAEMNKLASSEFGIIYVRAGTVVFEGRRRRGGASNVRLVLDENDQIVAMNNSSHDRSEIINRVQVSIHPRRRDAAATTVLFNLGSSIQIIRGTSAIINCPYRDPNQQAQRVAGTDMVDPVATTDYTFNTQANGLGTNITGQLVVTASFGGNSAQVTVTNPGPMDGFIPANGLKLRGRGLYDFEPVISDRSDSTSIAAYGQNVFGYDMPYQSDPLNALDVSQFLLFLNKDPQTRVQSVTYVANWSDETVEAALHLEISDRIAIEAPSIGLAQGNFFVNGVTLDVRMSGLILVTYALTPASTSQFWQLDVPGRTELDETTILGYGFFLAGWTLDQSALGAETFLN